MADNTFSLGLSGADLKEEISALNDTKVIDETEEARETQIFTGSGVGGYTPSEEMRDSDLNPFTTPFSYSPSQGFLSSMRGEPEGDLLLQLPERYQTNPSIKAIVRSPEYINSNGIERRGMIEDSVNAANQAIYQNTGRERVLLDLPGTMFDIGRKRVQDAQVLNPDTGEMVNRTYTVPSPDGANLMDRSVKGGLSRFAKSVTELGAKAVDALAPSYATLQGVPGDVADQIDIGAEKYVEENMATVPPEGTLENILQEVTSIVAGGGAGGAIVKGLTKFKSIARASDKLGEIGEGLANIWAKTGKVKGDAMDMAQRSQKFKDLAKVFLIERGITIGGTIAEPDIEPFFNIGQEALAAIGINPDENKYISIYVDNELFNGILGSIIKVAGAGGRYAKNAIVNRGKNVKSDVDAQKVVAYRMFKDLDSGLADDATPELTAFRMGVLADVLDKYKTFNLQGLSRNVEIPKAGDEAVTNLPVLFQESLLKGDIQLDTATAMVTGSREYAEKAYAGIKGLWQRQNPDASWDVFLDEKASEVAANILSLRKGRALANSEYANTVTELGDSTLRSLENAAEDIGVGTPNNIEAQLAQPIVDSLNQSRGAATEAVSQRLIKEVELTDAFDNDQFINGVRVLQETSPSLSGSVDNALITERQMGDQLIEAYQVSKKGYNDLFDNLPSGVPFNVEALSDIMSRLKTNTGDFGELTSNAYKQDPIATMLAMLAPKKVGVDTLPEIIPGKTTGTITSPEGGVSVVKDADIEFFKPILENPEQLALRLMEGGVDLRQLYKVARPNISKLIDSIIVARGAPAVPDELLELKRFIDEAAETSGDPSFVGAMDAYKAHEALFNGNTLLNAFTKSVDAINPKFSTSVLGVSRGVVEAQETAILTIRGSMDKLSTGYSDQLLNLLKAAGQKDPAGALSGIYISNIIKDAASNIKRNSTTASDSLRNALNIKTGENLTLGNQLQTTNPEMYTQLEDTIKRFQDIESGVVEAGDLIKQLDEAHALNVQIQSERAASAFINNMNPAAASEGVEVLAAAKSKWGAIFDADNSIEQIEQLYAQADEIGNPLIRAGIQSNYLKHLRERLTTTQTNSIGVGSNIVYPRNSVSVAQLAKMLDSEFDTTMGTLEAVFKNNPKHADQIKGLLGLINQVANQTSLKTGGNMFKSDTAMNLNLEKQLKTMVMIGFGILNPLATKANRLASAYAERSIAKSGAIYDDVINAMLISPQKMADAMRIGAKDQKKMLKMITGILGNRGSQLVFVNYRNLDRDVELNTRTPAEQQTDEILE